MLATPILHFQGGANATERQHFVAASDKFLAYTVDGGWRRSPLSPVGMAPARAHTRVDGCCPCLPGKSGRMLRVLEIGTSRRQLLRDPIRYAGGSGTTGTRLLHLPPSADLESAPHPLHAYPAHTRPSHREITDLAFVWANELLAVGRDGNIWVWPVQK